MLLAFHAARMSALLMHGPSGPAAAAYPAGLVHALTCMPGPASPAPACVRASTTQAAHSKKAATSSSRHDDSPTSSSAPTSQASSNGMPSSWWTNLRTALFPVPAASPQVAGRGPKASGASAAAQSPAAAPQQVGIVPLSPNMQRLQRAREAAKAQELQQAAGDPFITLSKEAEQFSGWMFKGGVIMLSVPLAVWFLSTQLLVELCIKGLRSTDPRLVKLSLSRVQYYIFNETLAGWFEKDDGVVMVVSVLGHQALLENKDVTLECLATIMHLMRFEETRAALLLGMVTDRLKKVLDRGWMAAGAVEEGRRVYEALEAMKKLHMEQMFGVAEGTAP